MIDILMNTDTLSIVGPPDVVTLVTETGATGPRGSLWFTGAGMPSSLTIPDYDSLKVGDMYIDQNDGGIYQMILLPSNALDWIKVDVAAAGADAPLPVITATATTGEPGTAAAASVSGTYPDLSLDLTIPEGEQGNPGPANSLTIGTVTTGAAGSAAAASITGTTPSQVLNLTIPTGATGAVSAWEFYAAGRPDIVGTLDPAALAWCNAAPSGSTFYSTNGPQGAWVWRKRGATWVCVEGDTGDSPNFKDQFVVGGRTPFTVQLRRINETTRFYVYTNLGVDTLATTYPSWLPEGYRPTTVTDMTRSSPSSLNNGRSLHLQASPWGTLVFQPAYSGGGLVYCEFTWLTATPWPTTLPGAAA